MKTYSCQQCGKENIFKYGHSANKFCSFECAKDSQRSATFNKIVEGRVSDRGLIRKNLIWKFGRKCNTSIPMANIICTSDYKTRF